MMKFRDNDGLTAKVVTGNTPAQLEKAINDVGAESDLIDMQYSTTNRRAQSGTGEMVEYSALLLVRERKEA